MWAVEAALYRADEYTLKPNKILSSAKTAALTYRDYLYASVVNFTILEVVKCVVGTPRPTFFDLCQPDTLATCNGYVSLNTWSYKKDFSFSFSFPAVTYLLTT